MILSPPFDPPLDLSQINPHYVAFARAHGRTPTEQMAHDREKWRGGRMTGFILWIGERKQEFWAAHPECFLDRDTIRDLNAWAAFIQACHTPFAD